MPLTTFPADGHLAMDSSASHHGNSPTSLRFLQRWILTLNLLRQVRTLRAYRFDSQDNSARGK